MGLSAPVHRHGLSAAKLLAGQFALLLLLAAPLVAAEPMPTASPESATGASNGCVFLSEPQQFNTQQSVAEDGSSTITIGQQRNRRYQVIIPGSNATTLTTLRRCVVDAFASWRPRFGSHIQVGSFARRGEAENLRRTLRREGYPARVIYVRFR